MCGPSLLFLLVDKGQTSFLIPSVPGVPKKQDDRRLLSKTYIVHNHSRLSYVSHDLRLNRYWWLSLFYFLIVLNLATLSNLALVRLAYPTLKFSDFVNTKIKKVLLLPNFAQPT